MDDNPDTIHSQIDILRSFLSEKHGMILDPVVATKPFTNVGKEYDTADMVAVDNKLNGVCGLDVIKNIRRKHQLLDIILYTAGSMEDKYVADLARYSSVEIVRNRRFTGRLKNLLKRNLTIWEDVNYLRGTVISRIIELEQEIDDVLLEVFSPSNESKDKFRSFLLENPDISMGAKKIILEQLINPMQVKPFNPNDLGKLLRDRNLLAHCKRSETNPNALVKLGHNREITKKKINAIFAKAEHFSQGLSAFRNAQNSSRSASA